MGFSRRLKVVSGLAASLVAVQLVNTMTGSGLVSFGIVPRTLQGLRGIALAPFIHGSSAHLMSNLLPFAMLSWMVVTEGVKRYLWVCALIMLQSGLLVWLLGRARVHVGASGLIFGLWTYLLARAWYKRSFSSLLLALIALAGYGGLIYGFIPAPGISFESHLAGALSGICVACLMHSDKLLGH